MDKQIIEDGEWIITNGLDSLGNDIVYVGALDIDILKKIAISNPRCVGFNTLGYMKYSIYSMENWVDVSKNYNTLKLYVYKPRFSNNTYHSYSALEQMLL